MHFVDIAFVGAATLLSAICIHTTAIERTTNRPQLSHSFYCDEPESKVYLHKKVREFNKRTGIAYGPLYEVLVLLN